MVKDTMEAVCIMFKQKPKMVSSFMICCVVGSLLRPVPFLSVYSLTACRMQVGEVGSKKPDYWEPARALLRNANKMKEDMLQYEKDDIPEDIISKITVW